MRAVIKVTPFTPVSPADAGPRLPPHQVLILSHHLIFSLLVLVATGVRPLPSKSRGPLDTRVLRGSMYPWYCVDHNQHDAARSYDLRNDIFRVSDCICLGILHASHYMGLAFQSAPPPPSTVTNMHCEIVDNHGEPLLMSNQELYSVMVQINWTL